MIRALLFASVFAIGCATPEDPSDRARPPALDVAGMLDEPQCRRCDPARDSYCEQKEQACSPGHTWICADGIDPGASAFVVFGPDDRDLTCRWAP